jgi:hypothetical protein
MSTPTKGLNPHQLVKSNTTTQRPSNTSTFAHSIARQEMRKGVSNIGLEPLNADSGPDESGGEQESDAIDSAGEGDIYTQKSIEKERSISVGQSRKRLPPPGVPPATKSRKALPKTANQSQAATRPGPSKAVNNVSPSKASNRSSTAAPVAKSSAAGLSKSSSSNPPKTPNKRGRAPK